MTVEVLFLVPAATLVAWLCTAWVRRYGLELNLIQVPNQRTSHVNPTAQGGGFGVVVAGLASGAWLMRQQGVTGWSMLGLSLLIAVVGAWDDVRQVSAKIRFIIQLAVMGACLWAFWPLPPLMLPGAAVLGGILLVMCLWIAGVWWINLFNFMDGIDGLAGSQAVFMLLAGAALCAYVQPQAVGAPVWFWAIALAAATVGFLLHNWPPARIFMGDIGSTYLAFMVFGFAVDTVRHGWLAYPTWLILGALFIADATTTLLRRMRAGERWSQPHRSHAYQRLSRRWGAHRPVTLAWIAVNVCWIAPLALICAVQPALAWLCVLLAYVPAVSAAIWLGAGRKNNE